MHSQQRNFARVLAFSHWPQPIYIQLSNDGNHYLTVYIDFLSASLKGLERNLIKQYCESMSKMYPANQFNNYALKKVLIKAL